MIQPAPWTLSQIVSVFKSFVTREARKLQGFSNIRLWQRGYYERVVRSEVALEAISSYIQLNPLMWSKDPENPTLTHESFHDT